MAKKKAPTIHVSLVLDETGSMQSCVNQTVTGFNEYIQELRGAPNAGDMRFTLTRFNSLQGANVVLEGVKLDKVPELTVDTYRPDATTPLYDAIGATIRALETKVKDGDGAIIAILTDGYENASREWTAEGLKQIITKKEKNDNWLFAYLGSQASTFLDAAKIGIGADTTVAYAVGQTQVATRTAGRGMSAYAVAMAAGTYDRADVQDWSVLQDDEEEHDVASV